MGAPDRRRRRRQARPRREAVVAPVLALLPLRRLRGFIALWPLPDAVARAGRLEAAVSKGAAGPRRGVSYHVRHIPGGAAAQGRRDNCGADRHVLLPLGLARRAAGAAEAARGAAGRRPPADGVGRSLVTNERNSRTPPQSLSHASSTRPRDAP